MNGKGGDFHQETMCRGAGAQASIYKAVRAAERPDMSSQSVRFGPFHLQNYGEALFRSGEPVRLGSRARQILLVLIARAGEVVSRPEIVASVWPSTTVVDNNLTVNIAALRQALGDGRDGAQYIVNVPGRGYRFVAPIKDDQETEFPISRFTAGERTNLPLRLSDVVGLSKSRDEVITKLRASSLVTVTGPAGVGKTTLALHVAQAEQARHPDGVWLVDLTSVRNPEHVPATVATAMRMELGAGDHTQVLIAALRHTKILLLLDNCEHLIDTVANFAALITQHCPDVALLGTSREPFRIPGEVVYSLSPLASPADAASLTAEDALTYPAVQLLVERVRAATNGFALVDENAPLAGAICRQLDGLPLAIELASPLIGVFGLAGLASRLDTPLLRIIQTNKRGASVRHRTLSAALDWSYGLLDDNERTALRRLAVFAGGFTLKGAGAVIDVPDLGQVGAMLARLHGKSLIANDITPTDLRFRLLQTTRAYAVEKLELHDDAHDVRRRHAAHVIDLLESQGGELRTSGDSRDLIDEVHQALDWTLSLQGDQRLGLELIVASAPLWFDLRSACKPHALGRLPIEAAAQINSSEPHLTARLRDIRDHNKFADGSATEAQRLIREMGRQHAEMTPSPRPRETACARRSTASF